MTAPLAGIKVVEIASFVAVPAAGALLAASCFLLLFESSVFKRLYGEKLRRRKEKLREALTSKAA